MKDILKRCLSILLAITIILSSAYIGLNKLDFSGLFTVKANAATGDCLEDMPIIGFGQYDGNQGDSTIFNLNRKGLSRYNEGEIFYGYGNIGLNGEVFQNGFEAWIARWNYTAEISWAYAIFDIGGNYNTLTGKTSLVDSYNTTNFDTTVYFYDGETLLASYRLTNTDYKKDIEVDVTGVKELKLYVKDNVAVSGGTSFAIYDLFFDKTTNANSLTFALNDDKTAYSVTNCNRLVEGTVIIPKTYKNLPVESIDDSVFYNCSDITSIIIPDSVKSIGDYSFMYCTGLTSVTLPVSIANLGNRIFDGCTSLEEITVAEKNTNYSSENGILFNKNKTTILKFPEGKKDTQYNIPTSVTSIGDSAFSGYTNLSSITIPDSVTSIGDAAFYLCYLESIEIPTSVTKIGNYAFDFCSNLTSIKIPDTVTYLGYSAFENCDNLVSVKIGKGITNIAKNTFYGCTQLQTIYYQGNKKQWDYINIDAEGNDKLLSAEIIFNYNVDVPDFVSFEEKFASDLANNHSSITNQMLPCEALIDAGGMPNLYWNTFLQSVNAVLEMDIFVDEKHFYEAILLDLISDTYTSVNYGEEVLKDTLDMASLLGDYLIGKGVETSKLKFDSAGLDTMWSAMQEYMFATDVEITKDVFMAVAEGCENAAECLDKISVYIVAQQKGQNLVYALRQMKINSDYLPLTECINEMINVFNLTPVELAKKVSKTEGSNKSLDVLQSTTLSAIKTLIPAEQVKNVVKIADYGANLVFPTSNSSDQMYRIYALYHIECVAKSAYNNAINQYKSAPKFSNAQTLVSCYEMFVRIYDHEIEESTALAELLYKSGVLNYVKNFFSGNNYEDYYYALDWIDSYNACLDIIKEIKIDSYNEWGLNVGKLQRVCLVGVYDGKITGYTEYFPETGSKFELPQYENIFNRSYTIKRLERLTSKFEFEGWYHDADCTLPCMGNSFTATGPAVRYAKFSTRNGKVININSNVDINIRPKTLFDRSNSRNSIVSTNYLTISNNTIVKNSGDLSVSIIDGCYRIFIPEGYDCLIKMQSLNDMNFNYTISKIENGVEDSRYNNVNIDVNEGAIIECEVSGSKDLIIEDALLNVSSSSYNGEIIPQKIEEQLLQQEVITISKEGNGKVSNGFKATKGDFVTIFAQPTEGEKFEGWYLVKDGTREKISNESNFSFFVEESQNLVAVFSCKHNEKVLYNYVANSCLDSGYSGDAVCWVCQIVTEYGSITNPKGHSSSSWITDKKATCTKEGSKYKECTVCEEILETAKITKKKHTASSWKTDKKATVYSAGKKHKECTVCGKFLDTETIKQLKCSKPKLSKIENTSSGVKITWGKVSGADKYAVYRKTSNGKYTKIGTTTKTYYTDKKASSGKKYYYLVKAINEAGSSDSSKSLLKYYLADPTLKTPKSTKKGIVLKWSKVSGADGYVVYRKTGSGSYSKIATVKGSKKATYTDKKAKKGKTYTYKVKAYKSKTYSAYSNAKKIKDKY